MEDFVELEGSLCIGGVGTVYLFVRAKISNATEDLRIWNFVSIIKRQHGDGQRGRGCR